MEDYDLCSTCLLLCEESDETGKQCTSCCGVGFDMLENEDCEAYSKKDF